MSHNQSSSKDEVPKLSVSLQKTAGIWEGQFYTERHHLWALRDI